jgi:hypothetical protein
MTISENLFIGSQKNLYYINQHKHIFNVDHLYTLNIFDDFAEQVTHWGTEFMPIIENNLYREQL